MACGRGAIRVLLDSREDHRREPAAGLQHAPDLGQRPLYIRDELQAEAGNRRVERARLQVEALRVHHPRLDVLAGRPREPPLGRGPASRPRCRSPAPRRPARRAVQPAASGRPYPPPDRVPGCRPSPRPGRASARSRGRGPGHVPPRLSASRSPRLWMPTHRPPRSASADPSSWHHLPHRRHATPWRWRAPTEVDVQVALRWRSQLDLPREHHRVLADVEAPLTELAPMVHGLDPPLGGFVLGPVLVVF